MIEVRTRSVVVILVRNTRSDHEIHVVRDTKCFFSTCFSIPGFDFEVVVNRRVDVNDSEAAANAECNFVCLVCACLRVEEGSYANS